VDQTATTSFVGVIQGTGGLVKSGTGTLALMGKNSYTGGTTVNAGVLEVGSSGTLPNNTPYTVNGGMLDLNNYNLTASSLSGTGGLIDLGTGSLVVNQSTSTTYAGAIQGVGGSLTQSGTGTLTLTGANLYTGGTLVNAGTLQAGAAGALPNDTAYTVDGGTLDLNNFSLTASKFSGTGGTVNLGDSTSTAVFTVDQSANTIYAGSLTGTGQFIKTGTGLLNLTGNSSTFAGTSEVNEGTLAVNGVLEDDLTVDTGARLQGNGSISGTVTVNGTIAAGGTNSIGTLTVGNYVSNANSTDEVNINAAGQSGLIHATGTATINGGIINVVKAAGSYTPGTTYTIVTADNGVTGTYTGLTQNTPFLSFQEDYSDPNHVYLDVVQNNVPFAAVAETPNEFNAGNGSQSLGVGNTVYDAIAGLASVPQALAAFDSLSGEGYASLVGDFTEESRYSREAVLDNLQDGLLTPSQPCSWGTRIWAQGLGAWGHLKGNYNTSAANTAVDGLFVGADQAIYDHIRLGMMGGYTHSNLDVEGDRHSTAGSNDYSFGLYGGMDVAHWLLSAGGIYTWHEIDMERDVSFADFEDDVSADAVNANDRGHTSQLFAEGGYLLDWQPFSIEPFANIAQVDTDLNHFTEEGGSAALEGDANDDVFYSTVGVKESSPLYQACDYTLSQAVRVGWQHAYNGINPEATFEFVSGGQSFDILGAPLARDAGVADAGVNMDLKHWQFRLAYNGEFSNALYDNGVTGTVTWAVD